MPKLSAGLLVYRKRNGLLEVLLVHPGGPFWARKDLAAWSVPKGEYQEGTDPQEAALREFEEETGFSPPPGQLLDLGEVTQSGGKRVRVWASAGDYDPSRLASNEFEMEWPAHSGTLRSFPEVDRAEWMPPDLARTKIIKSQVQFLDRLASAVG